MSERVLIAIPTRDRPAMLAEALRSVIAQDDVDWVAVVADSGDGPPAAEAAALPRDPRIHFTRSTTGTPGGARNAAVVFGEERVLLGRAALVAFLDDDDLWLPAHLSASRRALDAAPAAAFAHGAAITRRDDGSERPYHDGDESARPIAALRRAGPLFRALLRRNTIATSSVVVRGDALRAAGRFREDLRHGEDLDLWLRLLFPTERDVLAFVSEPTVVYREHGGNVSRRLAEKAEDQATVLSSWWARRHLLSPADRRTLRRELARRRRRLVRRLLEDGHSSRREVSAVARAAWREVRHLETLRARLDAWLRPRGRHAATSGDTSSGRTGS